MAALKPRKTVRAANRAEHAYSVRSALLEEVVKGLRAREEDRLRGLVLDALPREDRAVVLELRRIIDELEGRHWELCDDASPSS